MVHQFLTLSDEDRRNKRTLVTMSAGNYGKAFSFIAKQQEMPAVVYMPEDAPLDREKTIQVKKITEGVTTPGCIHMLYCVPILRCRVFAN